MTMHRTTPIINPMAAALPKVAATRRATRMIAAGAEVAR
jgi:hypothetical protein